MIASRDKKSASAVTHPDVKLTSWRFVLIANRETGSSCQSHASSPFVFPSRQKIVEELMSPSCLENLRTSISKQQAGIREL